jgi:hypothetical protein
MTRDVASMASEAVSTGRAAVDVPLVVGAESARDVELTKEEEDDACIMDSIIDDALITVEVAVVLTDGKLEGADPG